MNFSTLQNREVLFERIHFRRLRQIQEGLFAELIRDKRIRQAVNCFGDKIFAAQIKDFLMELIRLELFRSLLLKNTGSLKREGER